MAEFLGTSQRMSDDDIQKLIQDKQTLEKKIAAMSNVLADYAGEIITLKVKLEMLEQNGNHID